MNVLVTIPLAEGHEEKLRDAAPDYIFRLLEKESAVTQEDVDFADILLGNVSPSFLKGRKKLKWLQTASAGVEPYLPPGTLPENTLLTNATGAYGLAIAEHMLGMLLGVIKKLAQYRDRQHEEAWESLGSVKSIVGSTVLVLGLGDIGGEFAKRCKALGATVIGMRRSNTAKPDYADEIYLTAELDNVLPRADVVAIALPGTDKTTNLMNRSRIEKMKDGAVIVNVGRGKIIDTDALCDALESGKLMGAALDVTEPEPLPKGHRLWKIPTAVITPHISGYFHLKYTHDKVIEICANNLARFHDGKPLQNKVDFRIGYRETL